MILYSPARVLVELLSQEGHVSIPPDTTVPWAGSADALPTEPDNCVVCYNNRGVEDGRLMRTGEVLIHPKIILYVRAVEAEDASDKLEQLVEFLTTGVKFATVVMPDDGVYTVQSVCQKTGIIPMKEESESRRSSYVSNFTMTLWRE